MKNLLKLEISKALNNKFFIASVIVGCLITTASLIYNVKLYQNELESMSSLPTSSTVTYNPSAAVYTVFNHWVGGEPFSLGSALYFFVFPLLVTIPFGWSYCEEKQRGYHKLVSVYGGKKSYFLAKYFAVGLSGGLAMVIPLMFNFLLATLFFPVVTPNVIYDIHYGVFGSSLMSTLFYTRPFLYLFFYLSIDFFYCGLLACMSLGITSFIKHKWVVVIAPFFFCLVINFCTRFIYTSPTTVYKQLSPLYFLRPVESGYAASWKIILISGLFLFLISVCLVWWERQHEIY